MRALDPSLLRMLSFLTRRQAWLSPPEIARAFRPDDRPVSARTVFRWFSFLEEQLGLAYFPHPRMNRLGLAEVSVRIRGLRSPAVLSTVPWAYSFWVELGLDGRPFLTQDYWIPGAQLKAFRDYWATAEELGLVQSAEILASRNTHFLFSPFHEVVAAEGIAEFRSDVDNEYFANLLRTHLRESYEVCFGERIAASPLVVPLVLEHLWRHSSSRHVWEAIRAKGEAHILKQARGSLAKALRKEGAALKELQSQWDGLLRHFNEVFLQPVVFWPLGLLRNSVLLSCTVGPGSDERIVAFAREVSEKSVVTAVMPEVSGGSCRVWCNPPSDQQAAVLRLVGEYHRASRPPVVSIVDLTATRKATQPSFLGFDWQAFDVEGSSWRFETDDYMERLKGLRPEGR